jgi:phosphate transport system substrate-binding protein
MPSTSLRRRALAGVAALSALVAVSACMPPDQTVQTIALAGSDTSQDVMGAVANQYNADPNANQDGDVVENILSQEFGGNTVPGDAACATRTYRTPPGGGEFLAPNGSSNGRDALKASVQAGDGCIDVARSSSGPRAIGSDLATFEYNAFGLDALGWASASTRAPANMTLAQLRGIFDCTFTNWSQVGGTAGPIQRYFPQTGSGTYAFAVSDLIGFNPFPISTPSCPAVIATQENSGTTIAANADQIEAIVPYSAGNWVAQTRGTAPDQRAGQTIRSLAGQNLVVGSGATSRLNTAPGPVRESNVKLNNPTPAYVGIRYVFNVLDRTSVNYSQANRLFGFINESPGGKSPLCNGSKQSTIESFGFGALDTTTSARNLNGSTCRRYTP